MIDKVIGEDFDKDVVDVTHSQFPFELSDKNVNGTITIHYDDYSIEELKNSGLMVYRLLLNLFDVGRDENGFKKLINVN